MSSQHDINLGELCRGGENMSSILNTLCGYGSNDER